MGEEPNMLPPGVHCPGCGYDMGGLSAGVCPECGRAIEAHAARRAVAIAAYLGRCRMRLAWWIVLWLLIVVAFVILGMRTRLLGSLAVSTALLVASLAGFVLVANGFWRGDRGSRVFYRAYWLDNLWMLMMPLVSVEIASAAVWMMGRWGSLGGWLLLVWGALLVATPNVFLWRLHVLQMRMGISDTLPASAYGVGALLAVFVSVLGVAVLPI